MPLSYNVLMFIKFNSLLIILYCTIHPKNTVTTMYKEYFTSLRFSVLKNTQVNNYERNGPAHVAAHSANLDFGFVPPAMIGPL